MTTETLQAFSDDSTEGYAFRRKGGCMAHILDGKETAAALAGTLREKLARLRKEGRVPELAIVLAGNSKPSAMYAAFMQKQAAGFDIPVRLVKEPEAVTEEALLADMERLNRDEAVTGILLMMPLPAHIRTDRIVEAMDPDKDIDGITSANLGRLMAGKEGLFPCTPRACMAILAHYGIETDGKRAVVIGRSSVVGGPVAQLLQRANATVTVCHSHTRDLAAVTRQADILVAALGRPETVTADMVKPGAAVLDVGINRVGGRTVGDVAFAEVQTAAGWITPVPGGVGSVTTMMVIESLVIAAERQK